MKDVVEVQIIDSILPCYGLHKGLYQHLGKSDSAHARTCATVDLSCCLLSDIRHHFLAFGTSCS